MKRLSYLALLLIATLSSCNKWLDLELPNRTDEAKLYSKTEGFYESLAGVYSMMAERSLYGGVLTFQYVDLMGQYYSYGGVNSTYEYFKKFDYEDSGVKGTISSIWTKMYKCISQANNIIEWTDRNSHVLSESDRNQVRGEAMAIRAFLHFDLYRLFCPDVKRSPKAQGIPYNKTFGVSLPPMYTVEETVQMILNDLKEAETLLAADPIVNQPPYLLATKDRKDKIVARMNLYGVKAIMARVYLARGEYDKAVSTAQEVIESGAFRLLEFSSIDKAEAETDATFSDEHIFSLINKTLKDISQSLFRSSTTEEGATQTAPLPFRSAFAIYDGNNDDARLAKWFLNGELMKYFYENADLFNRKVPMIKLSEMYLIIAEASYSDNPARSLEYINKLRDHRIRNNVHLQYMSRETITEEMRREYLGEGQMWYVYKRNNMGLDTESSEGVIAPSDAIFVFPMPDDEIEDGNRNDN